MRILALNLDDMEFMLKPDGEGHTIDDLLEFASGKEADDYFAALDEPPDHPVALVDIDALPRVEFEAVEPPARKWKTGISRRWGSRAKGKKGAA